MKLDVIECQTKDCVHFRKVFGRFGPFGRFCTWCREMITQNASHTNDASLILNCDIYSSI